MSGDSHPLHGESPVRVPRDKSSRIEDIADPRRLKRIHLILNLQINN
jgi:hypothetical protein